MEMVEYLRLGYDRLFYCIPSRGNNTSLKDTKDKDRLMKKQPKSKLRSINHLLGAFSSGNKSTENNNESKDTQKMEKSSK